MPTQFDRGDYWLSNGIYRAMREFGLKKLWSKHSELKNPNPEGLASKETDKSSQIRFFSSLLFYSENNSSIQMMSDWWIVFKPRYDAFLLEKVHFQWFCDFSTTGHDKWYTPETKNDQRENLYKKKMHNDRFENFL